MFEKGFQTLLKTPKISAYSLIAVLAIISTYYNQFLPLHGDEAYYWMWSYHLQTGYYDHPPLIAYMIYITNYISEAEWGVRLVTVFSMSVAAVYLYKLAAEMFSEKIALITIMIFTSTLLVQAGYTILTPDAPLILFWMMAVYHSWRAFEENKLLDYVIAGSALGLMMLGKYTAILFPFILLIFIMIKRRDILLNPKFYLAIVLAVIVVSPMILWNYQNDWISFNFQMNHGEHKETTIDLNLFLEFFGGQFGIFTPIFMGFVFYILFKKREVYHDNKLLFLLLFFLVPFLFFHYKSLFGRMELNYTAPAFLSITIIIAYMIDKYSFNKIFKYGVILALVLSFIVRYMMLFHLEIVQDRMYGNKEAVALVEKYSKKYNTTNFYADHLVIAALVKYYLPQHPTTQIPTLTRFSQYDMWKTKAQKNHIWEDGIYLSTNDKSFYIKKVFNDVTLLETLTVPRIRGEKVFHIFLVKDSKVKSLSNHD
jgi:hypothetical protein